MTLNSIALNREPTMIPRLLESALSALVVQSARDQIELRIVSDDAIPTVQIDRGKLAWAVSALVGNALRYLPRGTDRATGGSIIVQVSTKENEVSIAVQDDGPGIERSRLERMFERGPNEEHMTGLALALVRDIVRAHGGRVELNSESGSEDHYTCVTLVVPVAVEGG